MKATSIEICAAWIMRERISRPSSSVPSQMRRAGPCSIAATSRSIRRIRRDDQGANKRGDENDADDQAAGDRRAASAASRWSQRHQLRPARACRGIEEAAAMSTMRFMTSTNDRDRQRAGKQHRIVAVDDADEHQRADARAAGRCPR